MKVKPKNGVLTLLILSAGNALSSYGQTENVFKALGTGLTTLGLWLLLSYGFIMTGFLSLERTYSSSTERRLSCLKRGLSRLERKVDQLQEPVGDTE